MKRSSASPVIESESGICSLQPHELLPTRLLCPWNSAGKNTGNWKWKSLSCVPLFVTPWIVESLGFSRPEHWNGEPSPSPGDLPDLGIEPGSPAWQADSLPSEPPGKPDHQSLGKCKPKPQHAITLHPPTMPITQKAQKIMSWETESVSHSVVSDFVVPWVVACQAPLSMGYPDKKTGVGCHFLLQGIFPTQGSNPGLPDGRWILHHLSHLGSPEWGKVWKNKSPCSWEHKLTQPRCKIVPQKYWNVEITESPLEQLVNHRKTQCSKFWRTESPLSFALSGVLPRVGPRWHPWWEEDPPGGDANQPPEERGSWPLLLQQLFSRSGVSDSLRPCGLQHARPPCPSPAPGACSNSCPWVGDAIQPSHPLSPPSPPALSLSASGAFEMSQLFTSGGQSAGASYSASVLPVNATERRGQPSCPSFGLRDSWRSSEAPCFRRLAVVRPGDRLLRGPWGRWTMRDGDPTPPGSVRWTGRQVPASVCKVRVMRPPRMTDGSVVCTAAGSLGQRTEQKRAGLTQKSGRETQNPPPSDTRPEQPVHLAYWKHPPVLRLQ